MSGANGTPTRPGANAERFIVPSIIVDPRLIAEARDLDRYHFIDEARGNIFGAMKAIDAAGGVPDFPSVAQWLEQNGLLESIGGPLALLALEKEAPYVQSVAKWTDEIRDAAWRRRFRTNLATLQEMVDDPTVSRESLLEVRDELGSDAKRSGLSILTFDELSKQFPHLRPSVIDGIAREGEVINIVSKSKIGKSWLAYGLELCCVVGRPWLDRFPTRAGRVLLIDNELHQEVLAFRIKEVAQSMGIGYSEYADLFDVWSLRGNLMSIIEMELQLRRLPRGHYQVILFDALYRMLPQGMSENDNAMMAAVYNTLCRIADITGAVVICIVHATKGDQSGKDVTDVGSGAGSQSRAADTHLILRPHEESGCVVLDAAIRSFAPIEPMALRWEFPIWAPDSTLCPDDLKGTKSQREQTKESKDSRQTELVFEKLKEHGPATVKKLIGQTGISRDKLQRLLGVLHSDKRITSREVTIRGNPCDEYLVA